MKRFDPRELRCLLKTQAWSIHEPALSALLDVMRVDTGLSAKQINERLGLGKQRARSQEPVATGPWSLAPGSLRAEVESTAQMVGSVAVLPVFGVLQQRASWMTKYLGWTATEQLERDFKAALNNDQVKAIVLYCDSPGGVAVGIDEVSSTIFGGRKSKPIHAFVRGYCASAAYHLASSAHKLTATPSSTVGSVGTIYTHVEYADALKQMGLGVTIIKHGARKGDGNPYEKLSGEAKASLQRWVDAYGDQFDAAVARNRGITVADVRGQYGQGEAFLAAASQARGMIDAVGTWEQVLATLKTPASPLPQPGQESGVRGQESGAGGQGPVAGGQLVINADLGDVVAGGSVPERYQTPLDLSILSVGGSAAGSSSDQSAAQSSGQGAGIPASGQSTSPENVPVKVSARVRAALFARGLIKAQDCDDAVCMVAIGAFYAARGEACPQAKDAQGAEQLEDEKIIAALFAVTAGTSGQGAGASVSSATGSPAPGSSTPAGNVQAAHDRELAEARSAAAGDERKRQSQIRASAKLLNLDEAQIAAAIDGGKPHAEIVAAWHTELAGKDKPIAQGGANTGSVGADGMTAYMNDAVVATLLHFGQAAPKDAKMTASIEQLSHAPLWVHAEACLKAANIRYAEHDREDIAQKALAMGGYEREPVRADGGGGAYNRPGMFPNLLSALATKIFDEGVEAAETTYQDYAGTWPGDLPDFKPAPVIARSGFNSLDEVLDAEEFKEQGLSEECLSYMVLGRYGNTAALTPVLVADDDLGAFMDLLSGLSEAWELTKNRGCLNLITGNVSLLDGYALYDDTNHGNALTTTGAGVPSVTTWDAMQQKMAAQQTVGNKAYQRTRLGVVLVPPKHEVAAQQTFLPLGGTVVVETKQATADTSLNVFRGKVKVSIEPELAASSADVWYGFADPKRFRNATVVIAYFRGWGKGGRRERWYDPKTKCWYVSLEGRFGTAVKNYRTTVSNDGVA